MSHAAIVASSKKVAFCVVILLALLLAHGAAPSQAQSEFGYVFLIGSGSVREDDAYRGARLRVARLLIGMPHDSQQFQICFTGSASPGTDFRVKGVTLNGNCFTGSWGTGGWGTGAEKSYYIVGMKDNVTDPKESITATVSAVNWPAGYSLFGSYASVNFTIHGK